MKFFTFALLSVAAPLALSLGVPSVSSEEVNQVAARANLDTIDSPLADDALVTRDLAKRAIQNLARSCWGTNGRFLFIVHGVLISTEMIGNYMNYVISLSNEGSNLKSVLIILGNLIYEAKVGSAGTLHFEAGDMTILPGRGRN